MKKAALVLAGMLFSTFISGTATATETYQIFGQVNEIGTAEQVKVGTHYESQMYVWMTANCKGTSDNFYITLRSGNTSAQIANYRNIYDTFITALKEKGNGAWIRFDGDVTDCSQTGITRPAHKVLVGIHYSLAETSLSQNKSE